MDDFTKYEHNEIPVDFEAEWFQALVESQYTEDEPDYDGCVVEHDRTPRVEVRQVQYLLGRHVRTKEVRVITNRPLPVERVEIVDPCELCGEAEMAVLSPTGYCVCYLCDLALEIGVDR